MSAFVWRIRQFGHAVYSRPDPAVDGELRRLLLSDEYWRLLERLSPFDRAHHLRVYHLLIQDGWTDPDLLLAALLHDVGKADGRRRAGATHRAVHVVLGWAAPSLLEWLAVEEGWLRHGLWLSVYHHHLGANLVAAAGGSDRTCFLIRHHVDRAPGADPGLVALIAADNAAIR